MPKKVEGGGDDAGEGGGGDDIAGVVDAYVDSAEADEGGPQGGEPADPGVFGSVNEPGEHEGHRKARRAVTGGEAGIAVGDDIEGFGEPAFGAAVESTGPGEGVGEIQVRGAGAIDDLLDDDSDDSGGAEGGDHGEAVGAGFFVDGEEEEDRDLDVTIASVSDDEHDLVEEISVEIDMDQAEDVLVKLIHGVNYGLWG